MPSEARACAQRVLLRVFEQGAYADRALHTCAQGLSPRDRALAMRLTYGAVQRKATLDHVIATLSGRSPDALDPAVRAALRVGLYELCYDDHAAAHAVVDDAVELVKRAGSHGHGLVNAVMRRAAKECSTLLAGLSQQTPQQAALAHSHPPWLAELWWSELGPEEARALMAANNEPAELAIRVNTLVADLAQVSDALPAHRAEALLGVPLPEALVVDGRFDMRSCPLWREGAIVAQSRASMLVTRVLDPRPGERVLDLCAAPGGKTTHIAALMRGEGEVVAVERHPGRASQLREAVSRMRARNVEVLTADACALDLRGDSFDRVLVDAPCSGLGTLQGHPDLRWRADPDRVRDLAALQCKILATAAQAVRAGGTLVYSTCTIAHAENEQQIELFLASNPAFSVVPAGPGAAPAGPEPAAPAGSGGWAPKGADPAAGAIESRPPARPFLQTRPDRDRTAGFFVAKLRRE